MGWIVSVRNIIVVSLAFSLGACTGGFHSLELGPSSVSSLATDSSVPSPETTFTNPSASLSSSPVLSFPAVTLPVVNAATSSLEFTNMQLVDENSGKCVEVTLALKEDGTSLQLSECSGALNQQFSWTSGGTFIDRNSGKCIASTDSVDPKGSALQITACDGYSAQQWSYSALGQLVNTNHLCLSVAADAKTDGALIVLADCSGAAGQSFSLRSSLPEVHPCSMANGIGELFSFPDGTASSCQVVSCNSGYTLTSGNCLLPPPPVIAVASTPTSSTSLSSSAPTPGSAGSSPAAASDLFTLTQSQSLQKATGILVMQSDGNLVLYQGSTVLWNSNTSGQSCGSNQCFAAFQGDGNFVVYNGSNAIWSSHTAGNTGAQLSFSMTPPYLEITDSNQDILWASSYDFSGSVQGQMISGDLSQSLYDIPIDFTGYQNWNDFPVLSLNSESLQNLFRRLELNPALPEIQYNVWNAVRGLANTFPNAGMVLSPGISRSYAGAPWLPMPRISVASGSDILNYWGVGSDGSITPFQVLDVWAPVGNTWGLLSTGTMKNPSNLTAAAPGATTSTWEGPLWPPESHFPGGMPMLPSVMTLPGSVGVTQSLASDPSGRWTDNWLTFPNLIPSLNSVGYIPQACNFYGEQNMNADTHQTYSGPAPVTNTLSGIYKVNLGGGLGARWVLIYTNATNYAGKGAGTAEYFGLDAGPVDQWPGAPSYGQVFYGQEQFDSGGNRIHWSAAIWNSLSPRTASGGLSNCPGTSESVNISF